MSNRDDFFFNSLRTIAQKCGVTVATVNDVLRNKPVAANVNVSQVKDALIEAGLLLELAA